jgi:hypothetical protein
MVHYKKKKEEVI